MSLWAFLLSWFTPTSSLFLFLNLMIGTIVLTFRFETHKNPEQQHHHHHQEEQLGPYNSHPVLFRSPSLLDRVRSMNFSHYKFQESNSEPVEPEHVAPYDADTDNSTGLTRTPSFLDRLKSMDFSYYKSEQPDRESENLEPSESEHEAAYDPIPRLENLAHRSKSDRESGAPVHEHEKMTKSVSEKLPLGEDEGDDAVEDRRPKTARVEKTLSFGGDEEVDAKADDFINRFKQQLRLQRLDSLLRYKETLKSM